MQKSKLGRPERRSQAGAPGSPPPAFSSGPRAPGSPPPAFSSGPRAPAARRAERTQSARQPRPSTAARRACSPVRGGLSALTARSVGALAGAREWTDPQLFSEEGARGRIRAPRCVRHSLGQPGPGGEDPAVAVAAARPTAEAAGPGGRRPPRRS